MQILAEAAQVWPLAGRWLEILEKFARDNKGVLAGVEGSMAEGVRAGLADFLIRISFLAHLLFLLIIIFSAIPFLKLYKLHLLHRQAPPETVQQANRPSSQMRPNNNAMAIHRINMSCRLHPPYRRQ